MKSEDIARYVAGLEDEVERLCAESRDVTRQLHEVTVRAENAEQDARAALPALPDVGPDTRDENGGFDCGTSHIYKQTEADAVRRYASDALRAAAEYTAIADAKDSEAATAADTTPDTSRVTFGARHEGTGMVLLRHADSNFEWGSSSCEGYAWHRDIALSSDYSDWNLAAHAALAEVREALDTAEAAGVDVMDDEPRVLAGGAVAAPDAGMGIITLSLRARRYLAREVQALVDQGLRGDDFKTAVPYEVTDHRAPIEAADTSRDYEDTESATPRPALWSPQGDAWEDEAVEELATALASEDHLTWKRAIRGSSAPLYRAKARRLIAALRTSNLDVRPEDEDSWVVYER